MKRYVIVGAGAAGLTLAYHLCKAGLPVTVLEKESEVGGLARSFHYDDWHFDIGPHRFYSANPMVKKFLAEVLADDFIEISRSSAVHFMGHYHEWPLRLETLRKLPPTVALRAGLERTGPLAGEGVGRPRRPGGGGGPCAGARAGWVADGAPEGAAMAAPFAGDAQYLGDKRANPPICGVVVVDGAGDRSDHAGLTESSEDCPPCVLPGCG